uniref:C2 domain-containing protein n=1 Tax=Schistosoma mansoni TaxID=6183 RepID=A0A5K4F225_SCHMA
MTSSKKLFSTKVKLFFNLRKTFQPFINMFSSIQSKHQTHSNNSWMRFTKYSNVIGHIHFSLEYIYTLKKLNVIISHLTGVSNLGKANSLFPSQIQTIFIIVLQLRERTDFSLNTKEFYTESDDFYRSYLTTPSQTFTNPCFDQSFVFDIPFNKLKHSELLFSVLYSASNNQNTEYDDNEGSYDFSKTSNRLTSLYRHQSSQNTSQSGKIADEMLCIGEAIYRIDHEKIINYSKELIHIWQEFYPPLDSFDKSIVERKPNSLNNNVNSNRETKFNVRNFILSITKKIYG